MPKKKKTKKTKTKTFPGAKCLTPKFRLSFPSLFQKRAFDDDDPKYELTMLFDSDADLSALERVVEIAIRDKWGKKPPKGIRMPFRDGNEKEYDGYEDTTFVKATSTRRPGIVDLDLEDIIDPEELYAGCYCRASVVAYAYGGPGSKYKPGVSFGLRNVQKLEDGEAFDGGSSAEDDFSEDEDDPQW